MKSHRERGDNKKFITLVPKVLKWRFLICCLNNFGDFYWILIRLFSTQSVHTIQPLIFIYRMGNFVCHHWGFRSIYRPLSYPFRSLEIIPFLEHLLVPVNLLGGKQLADSRHLRLAPTKSLLWQLLVAPNNKDFLIKERKRSCGFVVYSQ